MLEPPSENLSSGAYTFKNVYILSRRIFAQVISYSAPRAEDLILASSHRFAQSLKSAEADIWVIRKAFSFFFSKITKHIMFKTHSFNYPNHASERFLHS